jgi:nucleoside-diphosphate-sugar epimerase
MFGPKDDGSKFIPFVISQLKENVEEIKLTEGKQLRDFIYIDDVVSAYLCSIEKVQFLGSFTQFDVSTGTLITVKDFLLKLKRVYETVFGQTESKLNFGAIPYRPNEMMNVAVNNKSLIDLGWKPIYSIDEGIKKTFNKLF